MESEQPAWINQSFIKPRGLTGTKQWRLLSPNNTDPESERSDVKCTIHSSLIGVSKNIDSSVDLPSDRILIWVFECFLLLPQELQLTLLLQYLWMQARILDFQSMSLIFAPHSCSYFLTDDSGRKASCSSKPGKCSNSVCAENYPQDTPDIFPPWHRAGICNNWLMLPSSISKCCGVPWNKKWCCQ